MDTRDQYPRDAWLLQLHDNLRERDHAHLLRSLHPLDTATGPQVSIQGRSFIQFSSNNYLGLAGDPEVIAAANEAAQKWGTGAGASRLVAGSLAIHHELESELAKFKHAESALLFPTGYMANLAVLTTFAGEGDLIVSDKWNHASLLDAARYSGAIHRTFPHREHRRAADLLRREKTDAANGWRFLVSDTVFSMDGDTADLPALCDVAQETGSLVFLDEAHATGVLGENGAGLAELLRVEDRIALSVGTLSKALGSIGGFVAGPKAAIDTLINHARSFIYTTALPPACAAAALAAVRIVLCDADRRRRLLAMARHVRAQLVEIGYDCGSQAGPVTPIIPVIVGSAEAALKAAAFLKEKGLFVPAIRPPTVPPNRARLRISLMATHTDAQLERLVAALRELHPSLVARP